MYPALGFRLPPECWSPSPAGIRRSGGRRGVCLSTDRRTEVAPVGRPVSGLRAARSPDMLEPEEMFDPRRTPESRIAGRSFPEGATPMRSATTLNGTVVAASDTNIQASRHFDLKNTTGGTFTVQKVFFVTDGRTSGSLPEDSFPAAGTLLRPGQRLGFEVQAWADHDVNVILVDSSGHLIVAYLHVSGGTTYPSGQNIGAGGAVYTFTPQPSVGLLTIGTTTS